MGWPEALRTPELRQEAERESVKILGELGLHAPPGQAASVFAVADGFEETPEDEAEGQRPVQAVGHFLIGRDGLVRWARVDIAIAPLPPVEELLSML